MITPRRTRLVRVPDLHAFRDFICSAAPRSIVLVPTRVAGRQLAAANLSLFLTRDDLYDVLRQRLSHPPQMLSPFERDSLLQAAAAETKASTIRPGLVAEMLRFYDQLRRHSQTVTRFQELMEETLGGATTDRGAERLLGQTRFLAGSFRSYEQRVQQSGCADEHGLRHRLIAEASLDPVRHIVVTVADWIAEPDGLFEADFDLLSRIPGLETIDIVCTEPVLGSGFHERLHNWWPGLEEVAAPVEARVKPTLVTPAVSEGDRQWCTYRDREEELIAVARRQHRQDAAAPSSVGVIFKRPLPYIYLAPDTLGAAGVPFEVADALPLAAEPTSAALDLVLDLVETNFTRSALVAVLRSPHFSSAVPRPSVAALDRWLSDARYLGELSRLEGLRNSPGELPDLPEPVCSALDAGIELARQLAPLASPARASIQIDRLRTFMESHLRPLDEEDRFASRERRARAAILDTLNRLAAAHAAHHDPEWSIDDLAAAVRRWIGEQTFDVEPDSGPGVRLLDDRAVRYALLDDLTIVGLVEHEWPERVRRNIFYPASLLKSLGWPTEKDRRAAADARFIDLLGSASRRVFLSSFTLDDEALVTRSTQLDEVPRARLTVVPDVTVGMNESSEFDLDRVDDQSDWAKRRSARTPASEPMFHGSLGPAVAARGGEGWSVSALETYQGCPFKFYAQHILKLDEEPDDEEVMDPRRQGRFVHEVFEAFFKKWQSSGQRAITGGNIDEARAMFAGVVEQELQRLPKAEAGLERTRLLGSSAAAGLGEAVFRMEAERPTPVVERLLEHRLSGPLQISTSEGTRTVQLRGKADRLDLLADGTFRLIDYKLGWPPNRARALQLPIYGLWAEQQLTAERQRPWTLGEAAYLAFKGPKRVVPLFTPTSDRHEVLADAQQRLAETLDAIERGDFPPTPDDVYRCETCSFTSVCRKDYVGDV